jgi:hypothetical protein
MDHLPFLLHPPAQLTMDADITVRRCFSKRSGQRMPLATPVSSSMVMNNTPRAEPGRCRTRITPATSTCAVADGYQIRAPDDPFGSPVLAQELQRMRPQREL